ncbi:uncharacterized protein LOC141601097 [Silene latifolia]|uniref:uncharacterized protein LOC141601097 n=1 Tax=Silene latifolia TaxID=37657 RepID=UPI003D76F712
MRETGNVRENPIHILIDSGSTHNFLDVNTATKLGCKLKNTCPLVVSVANGETILTSSLAIPLFQTQVFGYDVPETATSTSSLLKGLKTFFYNQTIDHFTYSPESYQTFSQRYYVKSTNWGGGNSPIFVYLGDEQALDLEVGGSNLGFLEENAPKFKALTVYIEHRFYGKSNPLGSMEESIKNRKVRGYFNSAQALADFAEIILDLKKRYSATHSPIIVFGVSYGGMLATWFRLKYPHIALGALASSAPILKHVVSNDAYLQVVTKDYKDTSENCYKTIRESWTQIINLVSQSDGLSIINKKINTCSPLSTENIMYDFLFSTYIRAAQYDFPPYNPVESICKGIDGAPKTADAIDKVYAGLLSLFGNITCFSGSEASQVPAVDTPTDTTFGWPWQVCSEMISFGVASVKMNDTETMFPMIPPYDPKAKMQRCQAAYGVLPPPNWLQTYYGGQVCLLSYILLFSFLHLHLNF